MSERNKEPAEMVPVGGTPPPSWLTPYHEEDKSLAGTEEYKVLSRIKKIQGMAGEEIKDQFGEGSMVAVPDMTLLAKKGESMLFVPLFFFVEFTKQSDLKDTAAKFILERSLRKDSELAALARDPDTRKVPYPDQEEADPKKKFFKHVEHLCFVGVVYGDHPAKGKMIVLSFEKGEFSKGKQFISAVRMRKSGDATVPLWAQVWDLTPGLRVRGANKWWGVDFKNPPQLYITEEEAGPFREMHLQLKADFDKELLQTSRDDEVEDLDASEALDASVSL